MGFRLSYKQEYFIDIYYGGLAIYKHTLNFLLQKNKQEYFP